ncbi:hypothetical protein VMCG_03716 [Cytospora schulzeri]|uniref:Uncharacterized protein n=1 Tax=Cytospora schulzeri TaxID=448051 RepID=A0A423WUE4_9PEZI|nr:hypothetical protein VMCG_03716 [Valsa malicola]
MVSKTLRKVAAKVEDTKARMMYYKHVDHHFENTETSDKTKHLEKLAKKFATKARRIRRWRALKENARVVGSFLFRLIEYTAKIKILWQVALIHALLFNL